MALQNPRALMQSPKDQARNPVVVLMYRSFDQRYKQRAATLRLSNNSTTIIDLTKLKYPEPASSVEFMPCVTEDDKLAVRQMYERDGVLGIRFYDSPLGGAAPQAPSAPVANNGRGGPISTEGLIAIPANWEALPWFGRRALAIDISKPEGDTSGMSKSDVHTIIENEVKKRRALGIEPYSDPVTE